MVAVKVLNLQEKRAFKSFIAECNAFRNIQHRNLVKIITCCSSVDYNGNDFKALVYEFMENGDLDKWLHQDIDNENRPRHLSFLQRLNIAIDIAFALQYLHDHCEPPIIHCDLKPSNVLLDNDMIAKVSNFGLARILSTRNDISQNQTSTVGIKGTIGYAAPGT
jgi:serine/threonine protein kinase